MLVAFYFRILSENLHKTFDSHFCKCQNTALCLVFRCNDNIVFELDQVNSQNQKEPEI